MSAQTSSTASPALRWAVIAAIAGVVLFASYRYAVAAGTSTGATSSTIPAGVAAASAGVTGNGNGNAQQGGVGGSTGSTGSYGGCCGGASGSTGSSGGCCGGATAPASAQAPKSATVAGSVQRITVDTTKGYYNPTTVQLKAGVPAEITFTQASGCLSQVVSEQLGFSEDLTTGAKTVKLAALQPGTYTFHCGMNMQQGTIVVK